MSKIEQLKRLEEMTSKLSKQVAKVKEMKAAQKANSFSVLVEGELERAETLLAAKEMVKKLQDMAEDLAKMQTEELMPLVDTMKTNFSNDAAERFNTSATEQLQSSLTAVKNAKDHIGDDILRLEGKISDEDVNAPSSDMAMDQGGEGEHGEPGMEMPDVGTNPFADETPPEKKSSEEEPGVTDAFAGADAASGPEEEPLGRAEKVTETKKSKKLKEDEKPTLEQFMGQVYTKLGKSVAPYVQLAEKKEAELINGGEVEKLYNEVFGAENWTMTAAVLTILSLAIWDHRDMGIRSPDFSAGTDKVIRQVASWENVRRAGASFIRQQYIAKFGEPVITKKDIKKAEQHGVRIMHGHHQAVATALGETAMVTPQQKQYLKAAVAELSQKLVDIFAQQRARGLNYDAEGATEYELNRLAKKYRMDAATLAQSYHRAFPDAPMPGASHHEVDKASGLPQPKPATKPGFWKRAFGEENQTEDVMPVQSPYVVESDHAVYQSFLETNPRAVYEVAPPGEKAEHFITGHKKEFKDRYGKNWERALYATAWKMFGEGCHMDESDAGWPESEGLKKGSFTTWCEKHGFKGPGKGCVRKAMAAGDKHVRGKAAFYANTVKPGGDNLHGIMAENSPVEHFLKDNGPVDSSKIVGEVKKKVNSKVNELDQGTSDIVSTAIAKLNPADKMKLKTALDRTPSSMKQGIAVTTAPPKTGPDAILGNQLNNLLAKGGLK